MQFGNEPHSVSANSGSEPVKPPVKEKQKMKRGSILQLDNDPKTHLKVRYGPLQELQAEGVTLIVP